MIIKSKDLKSIGIGESRLEYELSDMIHTQTNPTIAPLAQNDGVVIRLTAKESSEEKVNDLLQQTEAQIRDKIGEDRKSTRLNSSHVAISYAVFCLKKKTEHQPL